MSTIYIDKKNTVAFMDKENRPAAVCESGDTVIFRTKDCFGENIRKSGDSLRDVAAEEHNQATGPLYVKDAEPGDVLKIDIIRIDVDEWGCQGLVPGDGPLGSYIEAEQTRMFRVKNGKALFNDSVSMPVSPMIGVIGTAPKGAPIATMTPGEHGSNMDNSKIKEGVSLYLPVNVPGALLAIGDLHAVMGDGEVSTCGLEISGEVTVKVQVLRDCEIPTPFVESDREYITVASAATLDEAVKRALEKMHTFIKLKTELDSSEIIMLMSMACNAEICQVVNPLKTARAAIPRDIFRS